MTKTMIITDSLIQMMDAYETADHIKAQVLGKKIGRSMLQNAGALKKAHLIHPVRVYIIRKCGKNRKHRVIINPNDLANG